MGDIEGIINQYVEKEVLPDFTKQLSHDLLENIKDIIAPGNPGYDTGHLRDETMFARSEVDGMVGTAIAYYTANYGEYVDRGHHSWKGVHFMDRGLAKTVALYGGASWI